MKKQEVSSLIYNGLGEILIPAGFVGKKTEKCYRKMTNYGFQKIGNSLADYAPTFSFAFFVIIRFDAIEEILDAALSRPSDYRGVTGTVNLNASFFVGDHLRFEVHSNAEITSALKEIAIIFENRVFSVLDACNNIAAVERLLNEGLETKAKTQIQTDFHAGIVAAALCGRGDFIDIVECYRKSISDYYDEFRLDFEKFVEYVVQNVVQK